MYCQVGEVEVGQVLWCLVTRTEAGVRTLSPVASKVWAASVSQPSVHNLYPGTSTTVTVDTALSNGLKVALAGGLVGYIHQDMLRDMADMVEEYSAGAQLEARVLYVVPTLNTVMLTLKDVRRRDVFGELSAGQLVERAAIERVTSTHLLLKLGPNQWGVVSARNMKEGKEGVKNVRKRFQEGGSVTTRILGLDHCAGVAVCSLHRSLVSGVSRLDQLTIGQVLTVTAASWTQAGLLVTVGPGLQGLVPKLFLSDVQLSHPERKYLPGDKLQARVLRLEPARRRLLLTTKPILVKQQFTVVKDWDTAVPGAVTEGVVVKISAAGLLIQLWGELRGWAPKSQLSTEPIDMPERVFWLGQAVKCRVLDADPARDRISLSLVLDSLAALGSKQRRQQVLQLGRRYPATVVSLGEESVEVRVEHEGSSVAATLPHHHLTDTASMVPGLAASIAPGQVLDTMAWQKDVVTVLTMKRSLMDSWDSSPRNYEEVREGSVLPGVVTLIKKFGVFIRLPHLSKTALCPTRMLQSYFVEDATSLVEVGQTLWAKVVEVDSEDKKVTVSCSLEAVGWTGVTRGDWALGWLEAGARAGAWCPHKVGDKVTGVVAAATEFGAVLDIGGVRGLVTTTNMPPGGAVMEGGEVFGVVLYVDCAARVVEVTCHEDTVRLVTGRGKAAVRVKAGDSVRARLVLARTEHGVGVAVVTQPSPLAGTLAHVSARRHANDLAPAEMDTDTVAGYVVHQVTARGEVVLVPEKEVRRGGGGAKLGKRHRNVSVSEDIRIDGVMVKKKKISESDAVEEVPAAASEVVVVPETYEEVQIVEEEAAPKVEKNPKKSKKRKKDVELQVVDSGPHEVDEIDTTAGDIELGKKNIIEDQRKVDPGWDFAATCITNPNWQKSSIWSDDELDDEDKEELAKKKHVSKAEAKRMKRVEEEEAAAREQRLLDGEVAAPATADEFERLVVASPDSSLVWVQYMALVVGGGELEAARSIARRALEKINFRLEAERLNIFLAWLNLENSFGSEEAMAAVLKEALQCCDQYKVYTQVAAIYSQSAKVAEAEKIHKLLVRKFNKEKEAWIKYGIFYYKNNKLNDGRFVLQRSLQSLDKREHIEMSSKFAQIEFRYGESERGKTMFETILANYPKRTDLWSVYADQLVKIGDLESSRALFRRMATLDLQAKKMKFLFKKWLDFESGHGTEAGVSEVKQAAQKYLEGKGMGAETEVGASDDS